MRGSVLDLAENVSERRIVALSLSAEGAKIGTFAGAYCRRHPTHENNSTISTSRKWNPGTAFWSLGETKLRFNLAPYLNVF